MNHDEYKTMLSALLDGELSDAERTDVTAHLKTCADCQAYFAELAALHDALGGMEDIDAPDGFAEGVLARLREEEKSAWAARPPKRRPWRGIATLAACAAVVVLAAATVPNLFRMGGAGSDSAAPAAAGSSNGTTSSAQSFMTTASAPESVESAHAADAGIDEYAMEEPGEPADAPTASLAINDADDKRGATMESYDAAGPDEASGLPGETTEEEGPVLTLMGEGAAEWLAENAEPLGGGRWLVTVEAANALPDTLELVAADGLQEPADGTLIITLGTTENPR